MSDKEVNVLDMKDPAKKLIRLLDKDERGLATWWQAVAKQILEINRIAEEIAGDVPSVSETEVECADCGAVYCCARHLEEQHVCRGGGDESKDGPIDPKGFTKH